MAIDGVNNQNSNTALYTGLATAIGAAGGAGAAYLTKPYLKDDAPNDSFVKQVEDEVISKMSEEDKNAITALDEKINKVQDFIDNISAKSVAIQDAVSDFDEAKVANYKDSKVLSAFIKNTFGVEVDPANIDTKDMKTVDDFKAILEKHVDEAKLKEFGKANRIKDVIAENSADFKDPEKIAKALKEKGVDVEASVLEDLKSAADEEAAKKIISEKVSVEKFDFVAGVKKEMEDGVAALKEERAAKLPKVSEWWDSTNKTFLNAENENSIGATAKKIASKIQMKYAGIYGGIAAAVLGLGTFLLTRGKGEEEAPEGLDTEA